MSSFKKTLKTIVLFLLIVMILSLGIIEVFASGENFYYQDEKERAELSGTLDFLVCGSSHTMRSVVPAVLDDELGVASYNLSVSNATMQNRYELMKVEMERNPVNTVILGVSYNTMTRDKDYRGFEGDFYVLSRLDFQQQISYFFSAIQPSDYIGIYYQFLDMGFDCIDKAVHGTWVGRNDVSKKGYIPFNSLHYVDKSEDAFATNYSAVYNTETLPEEIYEQDVVYLNKILDLCNENNIRLIMITEPISNTLISKYKNLDSQYDWYKEFAQNNGIQYYDFNLYKEYASLFTDREDFHDANHLNNPGAEKFSRLLASFFKKLENGEDVEDLFYDSYEKVKDIVLGI